jgi:hypothetical protein
MNMVGGILIEKMPMVLTETGEKVVRLWVKDTKTPDDERAIYVEPTKPPLMPLLGKELWRQGSWVYYDNDKRKLKKIGYSFDPRAVNAENIRNS